MIAPPCGSCWRPGPSFRQNAQMTDNYFDETVAARYDASSADMFDPAVLNVTVDFLADLAGDGRA
jgi:hypothetical protein